MSVYRILRNGYIDEAEWLLHWNDLETKQLYYQEQEVVYEHVEQVYVGVDHVAHKHGNSILLRLSNGKKDGRDAEETEKYVFVSWEICTCST